MTLPKGQHLHFDCASGASGDMLLGAFIDLGVPIEVIGAALDAIESPRTAAEGFGSARLRSTRIIKHGMVAVAVRVADGDEHTQGLIHGHGHGHAHSHSHGHGHSHSHGHSHGHSHSQGPTGHAHHLYADIRSRILAASLTEGTRRRALDTFDRLAAAEAKLHGTTVERVAFHEVGAIDSIVDIVGAAAALDHLAPVSASCASVAMGHGSVVSAHGVMPIPAPAALEVLRQCGGVMMNGGVARELCTPTGAAILASAVTEWTAAPSGRALAIGWGAGTMELEDRANVVRVVVMARAPQSEREAVWQIEANIDDMNPELCAHAAKAMFAAGALDVWWTPIAMKKGRPALLLSALAAADHREAVIDAILKETTTIGVRYAARERRVLARQTVLVETRFGAVAMKETSNGEQRVTAAPEYESCSEVAQRAGVPLNDVYTAALVAYEVGPRGRRGP